MPDFAFTFPVDVTALPPKGRVYEISADEAAREKLAQAFGVERLNELTASLTVAPAEGGTVAVTGSFAADLVQSCVVTLAPVPAKVSEDISRRFYFAPTVRRAAAGEGEEAGWVDPSVDTPDPIENGEIDLGAIVSEQLSLSIDPYPRAPGAAFQGEAETPEPARESPFAALAGLGAGAVPRRTAGRSAGGSDRGKGRKPSR
jgi:uncharacterized metal-binding protein YceD (DUF177 family)